MNRIAILMLALVASLAACDDAEPEAAAAPAVEPQAEGAPSPYADGDFSLPGDPEAGAAVYQRSCVACHAADGKGNGGMTGANLADDETRLGKSNGELIHAITNGILDKTPPMPPQQGILSEQEIKDALAYVRHQFGGTEE